MFRCVVGVCALILCGIGFQSALAQDSSTVESQIDSGLRLLSAGNWAEAAAAFNSASNTASAYTNRLTDNPNLPASALDAANQLSGTPGCFLGLLGQRMAIERGKYDNNLSKPSGAALCADILPRYRSMAQQFQSQSDDLIDRRRSGMAIQNADERCFRVEYSQNDSCQTADAIAIRIINDKCGRAISVHACIATNGARPACGDYNIDDQRSETHYTCHGLQQYSVTQIK